MESAFAKGLELLRAGEYFAAHEALEEAWRAAPAEERDFFQGLVHVAVAWYQAGRGNRVGCERQLAKARRRLAPYSPSHRGVDEDRAEHGADARGGADGEGGAEEQARATGTGEQPRRDRPVRPGQQPD